MSHGAIFSMCTMLEILPAVQVGHAAVESALCNGRDMEDGFSMFGHNRPVVLLPSLFVCLGVFGNPSPSQLSPSSFISFPILD